MKIFINTRCLRIAKNSDLTAEAVTYISDICSKLNLTTEEYHEFFLITGNLEKLYFFLADLSNNYDIDLI